MTPDFWTSVLLSLTNEEVALVYEALGHLEPAGEAVTLRKKLAPLLSNEVDSEDALPLPKTAASPSPDGSPSHPNPSACARNGTTLRSDGRWKASGVFARASNTTSHSVISALASAHYDSPLQSPTLWIDSVRNSLVNSQETFEGNDLESIISRCQALRESDVAGQFLQMLAGIQLSFVYQDKHITPSMTKFYHSHVRPLKNAPALRTFQEWLATGAKFGRIAAGGSVYTLLLLSGLGLQSVAGRVHGLVHSDVATMLRSPQTAEPGTLASIRIPNLLISILRLPLLIEIGGTLLDCTSFKESDRVLGGLKTLELQLPPRSSSAWQPCSPVFSEDGRYISISKAVSTYLNRSAAGTAFSPQPSQSADIRPRPALPDPMPLDVTIIKTCYSRFHTLNTCLPAQRDRQENVAWTNLYREKAEQGRSAQSVLGLRKLLQDFYPNGYKASKDVYIRVPIAEIFAYSALELQNDDGSLMAFICTAMPKGMKDLLFPSLIACLDGPDLFTARPSSLPAGENTPPPFDCLHFSWYNRYTTKGNDAPSNVHPYELRLGNSRTNTWQMLPYPSRDMAEYGQLFDRLTEAFRDVFAWIGSMLQVHLPEAEYEALAQVAESLPGNAVSAVEPFVSLVVNINVRTEAHRDQFDKNLCLALAIGDFSGSGLVLHEQGLVLELQNGDFAVFRSSETTHFNLNYVGRRATFVMQTDAEFDKWTGEQNGWGHSDYL
ncbi:hypothetical protein EDC04DRAFT_2570227 [Pisolithus marmoratus]|nr:hypothetical protein EDC04DRAFT_2570227 [Pisolithus marmoratus]